MCMRENALFNAGGAARGGEPAAAAAAQHGAPCSSAFFTKTGNSDKEFFLNIEEFRFYYLHRPFLLTVQKKLKNVIKMTL